MLPLLRLLVHGKLVRRTPFDLFGCIAELHLERQLIDDYEVTLRQLLPTLSVDNLAFATEIANAAAKIHGLVNSSWPACNVTRPDRRGSWRGGKGFYGPLRRYIAIDVTEKLIQHNDFYDTMPAARRVSMVAES